MNTQKTRANPSRDLLSSGDAEATITNDTVVSASSEPIAARSAVATRIDPLGHEPIRAELYSQENLEAHATALANALSPVSISTGRPLLGRFHQNQRVLAHAHRTITEACGRRETIDSDAEWFLDNFHIIEDALREVQTDLPSGYYAELPKLSSGPFAGLPRVYALALELIAHTDGSLDESSITRFVQAFQSNVSLTIGELWATPIMLRLGLLENLRRLGDQMVQTWHDRCSADSWAESFCIDSASREPEPVDGRESPGNWFQESIATFRQRVRRNGAVDRLSDPFVVRLLLTLRDLGPGAEPGVKWLENRLAVTGAEVSQVMHRESQRQAANQLSVGNCVTSLRLLSALDWTVFFERTSVVEAALRQDPAGAYAAQDFATRDRYRRVVEHVARVSRVDEIEVAHRVLSLAKSAGADNARSHIGFYLIDRGLKELKTLLRYRPRIREWVTEAILNHPKSFHFGLFGTLLTLILSALVAYGWYMGAHAIILAALIVVALIPVSELAIGIANHFVTLLLPPRVLPKLALQDGIPPQYASFVVMPAMLLDSKSADVLLERLELHYLSNPDPELRFALLTDFADAPAEHMPEDERYLATAVAGVHALNERYGGKQRFFLMHRRRNWNPEQQCWMGWERKRGKLLEFNRLICGARDTSFTTIIGDLDKVPRIRFCITLDADTRLPREAARRLVGTIAHPLNQPHFDPELRRVTQGYGVLQPRVSLGLTGATRSLFARIFTGSAGIDPYTTAVSDVYQDLYGIGSYTGKGIYDVDAFEAAVGHTFPENHILSHDLIEGNHARCGLVTDIELFDDFPARYDAYAGRDHRWVRGDWQILPWLFATVPAPEGRRKNPLPFLERWKIFDNLRRSLVPPTLVAFWVLGWTVLPGSPWLWTAAAGSVIALPLLLRFVGAVLQFMGAPSVRRVRELRGDLASTAGQVLLSTTFLADQARWMIDAIARTLVRLFVTRRRLLEWESAAATEKRLRRKSGKRGMWLVSAFALALAFVVALVRPTSLPAALPLLVAWAISPAVAASVSRPRKISEKPISDEERLELRRIARKTWHFFETFVGSSRVDLQACKLEYSIVSPK